MNADADAVFCLPFLLANAKELQESIRFFLWQVPGPISAEQARKITSFHHFSLVGGPTDVIDSHLMC